MKKCISLLFAILSSFITYAISPITGSTSTCVGGSATLSDATCCGTWTSSNPAIATVGATSGTVSGIAAGSCTITYTVGTAHATTSFIVNPADVIVGPTAVCVGTTITLTGTPGGGSWTSGAPGIATVNSLGVVTGVSTGVVNIYYTAGGCYTFQAITVGSSMSPITGTTTTIVGGTSALSCATPGGIWSSANPAIATVSSTGVVTGVAAGTCNIIYSFGGCSVYASFTVTAPMSPITGSSSVCIGSTTTLSCATPGGTWSSSNPAIATIHATSGLVSGLMTGSVTITYTVGSTYVTAPMTVVSSPVITGSGAVAVGSAITLSATPSGGSWSSANPSIATVSSAGLVTGIAPGVVNIYYTNGCSGYKTVTVNPAISISGYSSVCVGSPITLTATPSGGTWTTCCPGTATVTSGGIVTGVSAGVATITYTTSFGAAYKVVTVNPLPVITGSSTVTVGSAITLGATPGGGSWTSGSPTVATVSSSGVVTGISPGIVNIYYTNGCSTYKTITVNPVVTVSISGGSTACVGYTITLTGSPSGGTWTSCCPGTAVVSGGGIVTGLSAGVATITYTTSFGPAYKTVTIDPVPLISGSSTVVIGSTITLSATPTGGSWTSSNPAIASVSSSGVVTGVTAGVVNIYYAGTCSAYKTITVNPAVSVSGYSSVCVGSPITLTGTPSGGTWTTCCPGIATVSGGIVTGVSGGVATITYTTIYGADYKVVTVNPVPVVTGSSIVAIGATTTLTATPTGGSWTSGSPSVATVSPSGVVTGITTGVVNIYYTNGCATYKTITVNPAVSISGYSLVCVGSTITLSGSPLGGTWLSCCSGIATVSSAGIVTGISAGVATITYITSSGSAFKTITVDPLPVVTGSSTVCSGSTISLSAFPTGGTWTSGSPSVATVSSSGVVTGLMAGVVNIYYTNACSTYKTVTVNTSPVISGPSTVCMGSATLLTGTPSGGTWTSCCPGIATVSSSGLVSGMSAGIANITYTVGSCYAVYSFTVNTPPVISGPSGVCTGSSICTGATPAGGSWSAMGSPASVSSSGIVTGLTAGVADIIYSYGGCSSHKYVTVNPTPSIAGPSSVFIGFTMTLTGSPSGGTWSSSDPSRAFVSSSGLVIGLASGTVTITYTYGGCSAYKSVTVTGFHFFDAPGTNTASSTSGSVGDMSGMIGGETHPADYSQAAINASVNVFPNPAGNLLTISWQGLANTTAMVVITDIAGREVIKTNIDITAPSGQSQLGLAEVNNGLYIITIVADKISYSSKLLVQH